jgi:SAM-dependent methyltransferase
VATGPGHVAAAAQQRGAAVWAVDFSAAQVRLASRRYPGIAFAEGDAAQLRFADAHFDAVVCGFGANHFPDYKAFLAEARRVLRPGGRVALSVWDRPEAARAYGALFDAIRKWGTLEAGLPTGPDPFELADPARGAAQVAACGFRDVRVRIVAQCWRVANADECFETFLQGAVRVRALLNAQPPAALPAIRIELAALLDRYRRGASLEIPMPAVLTSGAR